MKYNHTSANTSFVDQPMQLSENKSLKIVSQEQYPQSTSSQKFYLRYYLLLSLAFSNNFSYFGFNPDQWNLLLVSIGFFLMLITFSILAILCSQHEDLGCAGYIFTYPTLLFLTGVSLLIIDPQILGFVTQKSYDSCISSLQTLVLLTALGYNYSERSVRFPCFVCGLAVTSLVLSLFTRSDTGKVVFEFLLLVAFILSGTIYLHYSRSLRINTVVQDTPVFSGVEEIIHNIDKVLGSLIDINENSESKKSLPEIITKLRLINIGIRKTPNIYTTKISSFTKDMDEEDKLFIEQACFESYTLSNGVSPKHIDEKHSFDLNYGVSELIGLLKGIGNEWNFNTFFVHDCSGGSPLQVIGQYILKRFGLDETFSMSELTISAFCKELELKYERNPYHNSTHAADVMCSFVYLLQNCMIMEHITSLELLACIISALAHDLGHPGKNNRFLVMSRNEIAIFYNDISVLEMMHASLLFQLLKEKQYDILQDLGPEQWGVFRKDVIDMILATDMGKHFELLGQFKVKYLSTDLHDMSNGEVRLDLFKLMIKAADVGHAAKSTELHESWCNLVIQEFYEQGDMEKLLGLPLSMYCDRENTDVSKSQLGFIRNIVLPLFNSLNIVLSSQMIEEKCIRQLWINQTFWENKKKASRGQSLIMKKESSGRSSFLPRIVARKGSLPEMHLG